jgi:hypothetical protein
VVGYFQHIGGKVVEMFAQITTDILVEIAREQNFITSVRSTIPPAYRLPISVPLAFDRFVPYSSLRLSIK